MVSFVETSDEKHELKDLEWFQHFPSTIQMRYFVSTFAFLEILLDYRDRKKVTISNSEREVKGRAQPSKSTRQIERSQCKASNSYNDNNIQRRCKEMLWCAFK